MTIDRPGTAYYNEFNEHAAAWLRNLIAAGHIAPGVVDTRSIEDVRPSDLAGFTQCHFFAGLGGWSYALRAAGWRDDRPVWTGSCPCQPFSAAGKGLAFADERHLWPAFGHLIRECKPASVLGEQVASKDVDAWIDLVHADLEAMGYAFGSVPFPSAGIGAPHIRDRNYWVGHAIGKGLAQRERERGILGRARRTIKGQAAIGAGIHPGRLADNHKHGLGTYAGPALHNTEHNAEPCGSVRGLADTYNRGRIRRRAGEASNGRDAARVESERLCDAGDRPRPTNGFWRNADWLGCTDGKWRPVEPGTFPLANGAATRLGRVRTDWHAPAGEEDQGHRAGRLKGYGNAINAEAARAWIECVMECQP